MGIAFTSAILTNNEALVVHANDTGQYLALSELRGQTVGAVTGTAFAGLFEDAGVTNITAYPNPTDGLQALANDEVKAFLLSALVIGYQNRVAGMWPQLRIVDTYRPVFNSYSALGVRSGDVDLLGHLQAALEGLKADETFAAMIERWALPAPPF